LVLAGKQHHRLFLKGGYGVSQMHADHHAVGLVLLPTLPWFMPLPFNIK
jgi:hypothetical protein